MKKKILLTILLGLMILPFNVSAATKEYNGKTYNTMNLDEALTQEGIAHDFSNYKETDDQITIYLFRGNGCSFCRSFLTFLKDSVGEYGKYFKVVSFEVWGDSNNAELMSEVSKYMNANATGVPFFIIGDQYFPGYIADWNDAIKEAIKKEYENTNRTDIFKEMTDSPAAPTTPDKYTAGNPVDTTTNKIENENTLSVSSANAKDLVLWNFAFMAVGVAIGLTYINSQMQKVNAKLDKIINSNTDNKKEKKTNK